MIKGVRTGASSARLRPALASRAVIEAPGPDDLLQFRADRVRRTMCGIGEQVTKVAKASPGDLFGTWAPVLAR